MKYPLALYGPNGWDDLADMVTARNEAQEAEARACGYKMLRELVEPASKPETAKAEPSNLEWDVPSAADWDRTIVTVATPPAPKPTMTLDEPPMYVAPEPFDWSRPWMTVKADLVGWGFTGRTKAEAIEWARSSGRIVPPPGR